MIRQEIAHVGCLVWGVGLFGKGGKTETAVFPYKPSNFWLFKLCVTMNIVLMNFWKGKSIDRERVRAGDRGLRIIFLWDFSGENMWDGKRAKGGSLRSACVSGAWATRSQKKRLGKYFLSFLKWLYFTLIIRKNCSIFQRVLKKRGNEKVGGLEGSVREARAGENLQRRSAKSLS